MKALFRVRVLLLSAIALAIVGAAIILLPNRSLLSVFRQQSSSQIQEGGAYADDHLNKAKPADMGSFQYRAQERQTGSFNGPIPVLHDVSQLLDGAEFVGVVYPLTINTADRTVTCRIDATYASMAPADQQLHIDLPGVALDQEGMKWLHAIHYKRPLLVF